MKTLIVILLLCTNLLSAQTPDNTFDTNAFLKEISRHRNYRIKKVDNRRIEWRKEDFYGFEGEEYGWDISIFKNDSVKKYFTTADFEYIKQQYERDTITYWAKNELKSFRLIDSLTCQEIQRDNRTRTRDHYYAFSTPLYTANGNFVILKEELNCGFMCIIWRIDLYKKDPRTGKWIMVTNFTYIET